MKKKSKIENDYLSKIVNNKVLLFLIPNLICWYQLLYYYNQNFDIIITVLFYEIILGCLIFFCINSILYLLLKKFLVDEKKLFCILCIISICYFIKMNLLLFVIFLFILIMDFKYLINFSLDNVIGIISFIVVILFTFTFFSSIYNVSYMILKSKSYDYEMDFKTDDKLETPNIYWIHCDAVMGTDAIKKYFKKEYKLVNDYFKNNNYYYNSGARLDIGHSTTRSLTALFNPVYYDDFYQDYLIDLEKVFAYEKKKTDFIVNYYELEDKRINNELFQALKEKNYETVVIGDFNPHIAFYPDHYYDYYHYLGLGDQKREFRYFKNTDNSKFRLKSQIRLIHSGSLFSKTIFDSLINELNILNYENIDYNDIDLSNYIQTSSTQYWYSKAVFKGIKNSYSKDKAQFTFIDYKLGHYPLTFDSNGNFLSPDKKNSLDYYYENYVYTMNLLFENLDYIRSIDKNAIIIVQGDHGINVLDDSYIMRELNINSKELLEVRNSVISAVYIPDKYRNGDEKYLSNPLNISRYLVNNFVGENYEYIK